MCSSPHWQVGLSWFREKLSPANRNKGYRGEQISRKIVSRELNARSYRDFAKNIALLGATSPKFAKSVGKKMGSNMRPRYIQFRDIHDHDISGLHILKWNFNWNSYFVIEEVAFQHVVCIMEAILFCPQYVKTGDIKVYHQTVLCCIAFTPYLSDDIWLHIS